MNDHGALCLRAPEENATFHVVSYADDRTRDRLAELPAGSRVRLELDRAGARANVWEATRVYTAAATAPTVAGD